ncbi:MULTISPECIES: DUF6759 domain-containing protein [Chryseobacterium]|uniref:DUF6759 domain-containing protein n=1 Tax=Chryseobacterium camelliae TaxID=1265445 RepID=A0ABU0TLB6_9FLAO|nr:MULTISPECIES: DUF6759 domain-containing protein [Chryseobacterium]MDT3408320.1 hypothetical protein [Pseudacidovorax intermedius]MDQ1097824.1 hypothetical protein [Chryseobacterium camelliae]MDQ1101756.1 hypothetical protein [Chryseobacterium sp. SORGH_AS_1048]MDR6085196.1 hypothetical protein [Chryseobacterium sp. SORGH_AS_0909]MDR6129554.1 hypothetical protein [Chryseobacterium sp. SORGH_AS_1175]
MKKIFLLIFLCLFTLGFSQKKKKATKSKAIVEKETVIIYTESDAENTKEARVIAGFLKQNPGHAKTDYFKRKLIAIITADNSPEAKPVIKPLSKNEIAKITNNSELNSSKTLASNTKAGSSGTARTVNYASVGSTSKKAGPSEKDKKTASMLTHLFNNDPMDREAYINIKNRSKCNLIVKISGLKYYNLEVPANGQNYLLVEKGEYVLTTMVCDAKYSSLKKINKDIEIELNLRD